jgi:hypothetical protein
MKSLGPNRLPCSHFMLEDNFNWISSFRVKSFPKRWYSLFKQAISVQACVQQAFPAKITSNVLFSDTLKR